jgi:hypothetical protein
MLTIVDLNRNEALSASEMGKVAGGAAKEALAAWATVMDAAGFGEAAGILRGANDGPYFPLFSNDGTYEGGDDGSQ